MPYYTHVPYIDKGELLCEFEAKGEVSMRVLSKVILSLTCLDRFEDSANPLYLMNSKYDIF